MKLLFVPLMTAVISLSVNKANTTPAENIHHPAPEIILQQSAGEGNMRSIVFKNQTYCRAELEDFEFDFHYQVIGAKVYFTGANFEKPEVGEINSNSLKPIKHLMDKCIPGTVVIFDEVKVKGPDNLIRTIPGLTLRLN
jgi:hypothetical protein